MIHPPLNYTTSRCLSQQIWACGPTPRWCRNTVEHSGNSPRSAKSDSSSSLTGKNIPVPDSISVVLRPSEKMGLSRIVEVVVPISPNQLNSSLLISESSPRFVNFSLDSGSGSGSGFNSGSGLGVVVLDLELWWCFEGGGQGWLCSQA